MQAVILAAGMGKRLKDLTNDNTKCMVKVNGVTMIERMLRQLESLNLTKIILVVGYEAEKLRIFVESLKLDTPIVYIENEIYDKTNNIYSLSLAKEHLLKEDTLLLESDLIFEDRVLKKILEEPYPNLALIAKFENWMDGTVVTIDDENNIKSFIPKKQFMFEEMNGYYKTVNIYKFSREFSNTHYVPFLEAYCKALGDNEYYEQVLRVITMLDKPEIKAVCLNEEIWYEIDDIQDLDIAESIFSATESKVEKFHKRYGGYWRYPHMIDFCYLVNPYFPPKKMLDEIKANFEKLIVNYPSGIRVNSLLAAKYFGIQENHICIGNGAAELIKSLMSMLSGNFGIIHPSFEEYGNRLNKENIVAFHPNNKNFTYNVEDLKEFYKEKDIKTMVLINPDNPTGNFIEKSQLIDLIKWCKEKSIRILIDESFVDFADTEENASLLDEEILGMYKGAIVVKSISKSFGVPGLRLGVMASSDNDLINAIKKDLSIWNINSFAEFYMQIFEKYKTEYEDAMKKFKVTRKIFIEQLNTIGDLQVINSQANYVTCKLPSPYTAKDVTEKLLNQYNLFIKDLTGKKGMNGTQYIRLAVRNENENETLVNALKEITQETID